MDRIEAEEAGRRIVAAAQEGRLIQYSWHMRDADGRELACLLGAISEKIVSVRGCPRSLMPWWLAEATVALFDMLPAERLAAQGERYGRVLASGRMKGAIVEILAKMVEAAWAAVEAARAVRPVAPSRRRRIEAACRQAQLTLRASETASALKSDWPWKVAQAALVQAASAAPSKTTLADRLFTFLLDAI